MIEVSIPSLERKVDESGKLQKLFRVEILFNGRKHFVLKRHREFVSLHKKLKKILQTPDFPNKRSPHFRQKPLEQRRQESSCMRMRRFHRKCWIFYRSDTSTP
uniref:Sorting nexin 22 n=1 Tax=Scleropages formosus TaxID=113540 RepID=A0A8C9SK02_SCLFO